MSSVDVQIATAPSSEESAGHAENIVESTTTDGQTTIKILKHYCKGCEICVDVCPKEVLDMVVTLDRWEGTIVEVIDVDKCNACMLCENQCPDFAIEIYNLKKEKKKEVKASA